MARSINFRFNTVKDDAANGKIQLQFKHSDGGGEITEFYVGVTSPSGEVLKAYPDPLDGGTPDATIDGLGGDEVTVDIPLDSNGDYLGGTYVFTWAKHSNTYGDLNGTESILFTPLNDVDNLGSSMAQFSVAFKCLDGLILATDDTDYEAAGVEIDEREITITPPSIDPQAEVVEDADNVAQMTVAYTNVTYQVKLSVAYQTEEEDVGDGNTTDYVGSFLIYREVDVECEVGGICGSLACVSAEMDKVHEAACAAGGFPRLPQSTKDRISWALMNLALAKMHYDCGNVASSLTYVNRATEAINCGCGCSDASPSAPAAYTPPAA